MRTGTCPRCHGTEVYAARDAVESDLALRAHIEPGFRGMRSQVRAHPWTYLCATCGLMETYVLDPEPIAFVQRSWLRVAAPPPPPPSATPSGT